MNNVSNGTTVDLDFFYQHIGFGLTAVATNCLIVLILCLNPKLLKKSAFVFTLAIGDFVESLALALAGFSRVNRNADGTLFLMVHPSYCYQSFVTLFLIGIQLPAIIFVLVGGERFTAVYYFDWYYKRWSNKLSWLCCGLAVLFVGASVSIAWLIANSAPREAIIVITCPLNEAVNHIYSVYHYGLVIVGGILAAVASIAAIITFSRRKRQMLINAGTTNLALHIKKQLNLTKILLCTTTVDFVFTVIPSVFVMLAVGFNVSLPGAIAGWSLRLFSLRSALNIFVYLIFNREFRQASLKIFRVKNSFNEHQVVPHPILTFTQAKNDRTQVNFTQ